MRLRIVPVVIAVLCSASVAAPSAGAAITFSRTDYPGGQSPRAVAADDLNRDGKPDLVTANVETGEVSVMLGNGDGTFQAPVAYATGGAPSAVVIADLDGDGKRDLAVADSTRGVVDVLLGNGDGTFQLPAATYPVGASPRTIVAADLTGDGVPDLATVDSGSNSVSLLVNAGDGTFGVAQTTSTGTQPASLAVATLDGDARPDLVLAQPLSDEVGVLLGSVTTPGGFGTEATFPTGTAPRWVGVADLDADGKRDVITADGGSDTAGVLLGNGDGTLRPATAYPVGQMPVYGGIADLDNDGKPDVVIVNQTGRTLSVLPGNGDGTLGTAPARTVGPDPSGVALADVNRDGLMDAVVANSSSTTVSVLLNTTPPPALAPYVSVSRPTRDQTFNLGSRQQTSFSCTGYGVAISSCKDGDGSSYPGRADTATVGQRYYTVIGTDAEGRTTRVTVPYWVAGPPSVSISTPAAGQTVAQDAVVATRFSCAEGAYGTGLASCRDGGGHAAPSGALDTSTPGPHTYVVKATSTGGLTAKAELAYVVAAAPKVTIEHPADLSTFEIGDTVTPRFTCASGAYGPAITSCRPSESPQLNTATRGRRVFSVTATAANGQTTTGTARYAVSPCDTSLTLDAAGVVEVTTEYPTCITDLPAGGGRKTVDGPFQINGVSFHGKGTFTPDGAGYEAPSGKNLLYERARIAIQDSRTAMAGMGLCLTALDASGRCTSQEKYVAFESGGQGLAPDGFQVAAVPGSTDRETAPFTATSMSYQSLWGMYANRFQLGFGRHADGRRYAMVGVSVGLGDFSTGPNPPIARAYYDYPYYTAGDQAPVASIPIDVMYDSGTIRLDRPWAATGAKGTKIMIPEAYVGTMPVQDVCFALPVAGSAQSCPAATSERYPEGQCPGQGSLRGPQFYGGLSLRLPKMPLLKKLDLSGSMLGGGIARLDGSITALNLGHGVDLGKLKTILCAGWNKDSVAQGRAPFSLNGELSGGSVGGMSLGTLGQFHYDDAFRSQTSLAAGAPWRASVVAPVVKVKGIELGSATLGVNGSDQVDASADLNKSFGPLSVNGHVGGWVDPGAKKFSFGGSARACVSSIGCRDVGDFVVSSKGLAVCANLSFAGISWHAGAGVYWNPFAVDVMWRSCGVGDYAEARPASGFRAAGAPLTVPVAVAQRLFVVHATGADTSPKLTLRAPDGTVLVTSPTDATQASQEGRYYLAENETDHSTTVMVIAPAAGTWTVESADPAHPVQAASYAGPQALPTATGRVSGSGAGTPRRLVLAFTKADDERVTLVERGQDYGRIVAENVTGAACLDGATRDGEPVQCATVAFRPGFGPAATRRIQAVFTTADGSPRRIVDVTGFQVRPFPKPTAPRNLHLQRLPHDRLAIRWAAARDAATYVASVQLTDGRRFGVSKPAGSRRIVVGHVAPRLGVSVHLAGFREDAVRGAESVRRLRGVRRSVDLYVPHFRFFASGRARLSDRDRAWLRALLPRLAAAKGLRCEGHSSAYDGVSRRWLAALSRTRARVTCAYLHQIGLRLPSRTAGFSTRIPRLDNRTLQARMLNARIEIRVQR